MVQRPREIFRRFARAVIDQGVDIYYGHSAHVFQGVEVYRGKPILYDTGDFIDDYAIRPRDAQRLVFSLSGFRGRRQLRAAGAYPGQAPYAQVELATGEERETILDRMEGLSAEMGTAFARREGSLVLERS